jgi:DNA-binding TFAR19-related protein (PDSD5 family)
MAAPGAAGGGAVPAGALRRAGFTSGDSAPEAEEQAAKAAAAEEARNSMLKALLTPSAKERLNRVSLVRPDNARAVEDHLIRLARGGKLAGKVDDDAVVRMLEDVGRQADAASGGTRKVTIQRKKRMDDDDDDDDF